MTERKWNYRLEIHYVAVQPKTKRGRVVCGGIQFKGTCAPYYICLQIMIGQSEV